MCWLEADGYSLSPAWGQAVIKPSIQCTQSFVSSHFSNNTHTCLSPIRTTPEVKMAGRQQLQSDSYGNKGTDFPTTHGSIVHDLGKLHIPRVDWELKYALFPEKCIWSSVFMQLVMEIFSCEMFPTGCKIWEVMTIPITCRTRFQLIWCAFKWGPTLISIEHICS